MPATVACLMLYFDTRSLLVCFCFSSFTETADKDYDMFQKQRDRDVNTILIEHIKTQMKLCKLVSSILIHCSQYVFSLTHLVALRPTLFSYNLSTAKGRLFKAGL